MRNKLLTKPQELLDKNGIPLDFGYSFKPIIATNREYANPFKLKEWDFYQISDTEKTLQITYGHVSYAGTVQTCLFDYDGNRYEFILPLLFPFNSLELPASANDYCHLKKHTKNFKIDIDVNKDGRYFELSINSKKHGECHIKLHLTYPSSDDGILIVTPFDKPKQFYHNYKQCCMSVAECSIQIGDKNFEFLPNSYGLIDWGRGILPYTHKWWWGNGSCKVKEGRFGFNIGVFGDNSVATENTLFLNGVAHKLNDITYTKTGGIMDKWVFTSSDGRFECDFTPVFDNYTNLNFLVAHNRCHQVFGYWNGYAILDNGEKIIIKDMFAFVEEAKNRW